MELVSFSGHYILWVYAYGSQLLFGLGDYIELVLYGCELIFFR
jgi:hypothetical protein